MPGDQDFRIKCWRIVFFILCHFSIKPLLLKHMQREILLKSNSTCWHVKMRVRSEKIQGGKELKLYESTGYKKRRYNLANKSIMEEVVVIV